MSDDTCKNTIIFIKDKLEKYSKYLKDECTGFIFREAFYEDFSSILKKLNDITRENLLIIINKEFYELADKEKMKQVFKQFLNFTNPHFLIVSSQKNSSIQEQTLLFEEQNFFYHLSGTEQDSSILSLNYFYLKLVFQRIKDISRLNSYIINSFKTIIDSSIINKQKEEIEKLYKELENLSKIDVLTNVLNRRAFFEMMEAEKIRTLRDLWRMSKKKVEDSKETEFEEENIKTIINKEPSGAFFEHYGRFSCMMIDIDDFKKINDTYGHLVGDFVLKKLGELLNSKNIFREDDIIGRYGGEEFVVILPETNAKHVKIPADRLRKEIKKIKFKGLEDGQIFNVSVSIGISEFNLEDKSTDEIINRADKALYYAKEHGKNQVTLYEEIFKENKKGRDGKSRK